VKLHTRPANRELDGLLYPSPFSAGNRCDATLRRVVIGDERWFGVNMCHRNLFVIAGFMTFFGSLLTVIVAKGQSPQAPASRPFFEVASIRINRTGGPIMSFQPFRGGRFDARNCSLDLLIRYAFDLMQFQIAGAPDWVKSERYDIAAKAEGDPEIREVPGMVQHLLQDRFRLEYHWDTKESPIYNLVLSKAGRLKEAATGDCPPPLTQPASRLGAPADDTPCGSWRNTPGYIRAHKLTAGDLASALTFFLGRPVLDQTGLTRKYDIDLQWTPGEIQLLAQPEAGPLSQVDTISIFTAIQDKLGLKLETSRGPVRNLVVDRVERPSEN